MNDNELNQVGPDPKLADSNEDLTTAYFLGKYDGRKENQAAKLVYSIDCSDSAGSMLCEDHYKAETGKDAWLPTGPDNHWTRKPEMERTEEYVEWLEEKFENSLQSNYEDAHAKGVDAL